MSKNIVSISKHPNYCSKGQRPRKRVFDLGEHWYSGAPGLSWVTNYWVKKIQKGTLWELYCSQEESLSYREYCGTYEVDELRAYFDDVDFNLEEDRWREMGLGLAADIFQFELNRAETMKWRFLRYTNDHNQC
ncbi:MAG: hypothetical protein OXU66_14790 [Gammaproteobacteria bacterium]|nr:hypothetical protein [Gammaproteobacteria bacterium]